MERNAVDNHYRALKTIIGVVFLIALGTTATYMAGKASENFTVMIIVSWLAFSIAVIGFAAVILRLFSTKPWLKWFMVLAVSYTHLDVYKRQDNPGQKKVHPRAEHLEKRPEYELGLLSAAFLSLIHI